jgi:hypothetical protein
VYCLLLSEYVYAHPSSHIHRGVIHAAMPGALPVEIDGGKGVTRKPCLGRNSFLDKTTDILKNRSPSKPFQVNLFTN